MKEEVLRLLRNNNGKCLSGEEISSCLNISRTAVWKHVQNLKKAGYLIEARHGKGYCLLKIPDVLYPEEIKNGLKTVILGKKIYYKNEMPSTQALAQKLADNGSAEGTLVITEHQKKGKGRLGRAWVGPPGKGLWFSIILRPGISPIAAPRLTIVAALAVALAIERVTGLRAGIKWPNDLLLRGKKVCGILTDMKAEQDLLEYIVVGIGINVNLSSEDFPPELRHKATSLKEELGVEVSRIKLLQRSVEEMERLYQSYLNKGFSYIRRLWMKWNVTLGCEVDIKESGRSYSGKALRLEEDGALLVDCADGKQRKFYAGDINLRS